ncbi:hypothetical protein CA51_05110 [Rosistilla oblonga]|uniref:Uncharacterized protein n=1 Tax=Rosistilla oblonga TaxID=2527990 RepID=A0A518INE1_9BACT|nr:hypothetical protein CA51_05110 [Rosistilla oblonga]QDV54600.1 hypothetical protein Mal33_05550 [Rosistilla oblonga]
MKRAILSTTLIIGMSICSQGFGFDLLDRMLGLKCGGGSSSCCETGCADVCEPACGCETSCCESVCEPACGCEASACGTSCCEPTCGVESSLCGASCCEPACGCETSCCEPACCDSKSCFGSKKKCCGLLSKLFGGKKNGCDSCCETSACCEPACGCEAAACCEPACGCETSLCGSASCCEPACGCDPCGKKKSGGLLSKLFGGLKCCKKSDCDSACDSCGCAGSYAAPAAPACSSCNGGTSVQVEAPVVEDAAPMPPAPVVDPSAYLNSKRRVIQASTRYAR